MHQFSSSRCPVLPLHQLPCTPALYSDTHSTCSISSTARTGMRPEITSELRQFTYILTPCSRVLLEKLTGSAASQEIPGILSNPKVHYRIHKCPPPVPILRNYVNIPNLSTRSLGSHLSKLFPSKIFRWHPSHLIHACLSPDFQVIVVYLCLLPLSPFSGNSRIHSSVIFPHLFYRFHFWVDSLVTKPCFRCQFSCPRYSWRTARQSKRFCGLFNDAA